MVGCLCLGLRICGFLDLRVDALLHFIEVVCDCSGMCRFGVSGSVYSFPVMAFVLGFLSLPVILCFDCVPDVRWCVGLAIMELLFFGWAIDLGWCD